MALSKLKNRNTTAPSDTTTTKVKAKTKPKPEELDEEAQLQAQLDALRKKKEAEASDEDDALEAEVVTDEDEDEAEEAPAKSKKSAAPPAKLADLDSLLPASLREGSGAGLAAFMDADAESDFEPLFWGVRIAGGDSGGNWDYPDNTPEDLQDTLPAGRKAFEGFVLAYRLCITAWRKDYEEEEATKRRPAWVCAIPMHDGKAIAQAAKACKNYQFTKRADKSKFDWDDGEGTGRPVPKVEVLVWHPDSGLITVACQTNYGAVKRTISHIANQLCDKQGVFQPMPVKVSIDKESRASEGQSWHDYALSFAVDPSSAKEIVAGFKDYIDSLDDEIKTKYEQWVVCKDSPLTDSIKERLEIIESI